MKTFSILWTFIWCQLMLLSFFNSIGPFAVGGSSIVSAFSATIITVILFSIWWFIEAMFLLFQPKKERDHEGN